MYNIKLLTFIFFFLFSVHLSAQESRFASYFEGNINPVKSVGSETLICYQGQLAIDIRVVAGFTMGVFGEMLLYYDNQNVANIDDKIIDMNSITYSSFGLALGYKAYFGKFLLFPKLDVGYNFFLANGIDLAQTPTAFLDYRYLSFRPKAIFAFAPNENFFIGPNIGYNIQAVALKGHKIEEFNPTNLNLGIACGITLQ